MLEKWVVKYHDTTVFYDDQESAFRLSKVLKSSSIENEIIHLVDETKFAEEIQLQSIKVENYMPRVNGEIFHCEDCGANVFIKKTVDEKQSRFICNGCGLNFLGENK